MSEKLSDKVEAWKGAPRDFEAPTRQMSRREIAIEVVALEAKLEAIMAAAVDIDVDTAPLRSLGREYQDGFKSGWGRAMATIRKAAQQEGR